MSLAFSRTRLVAVRVMTRLLHSPPSSPPPEAVKKARMKDDDAPAPVKDSSKSLRSSEDARQVKRDRKRIHYLRKAYAKQTAKNGDPPILYDILELLGKERVETILAQNTEFDRVAPFGEEVVLTIERLSAHGDGLARTKQGDRVVVVPFALPGEVVKVMPYAAERLYFKARMMELIQRNNDLRRDDLVQCQYFGRCGGCQYQMIPYAQQLQIKQRVVERAYQHYAKLDQSLVPAVLPTIGSPETMQYRTKLTPHFDLPYILRRRGAVATEDIPEFPIGFDGATTGRVMDIEVRRYGMFATNAGMSDWYAHPKCSHEGRTHTRSRAHSRIQEWCYLASS